MLLLLMLVKLDLLLYCLGLETQCLTQMGGKWQGKQNKEQVMYGRVIWKDRIKRLHRNK